MSYFQNFAFLFFFLIAASCGDCGSETSTGSATVEIDSIDPAGGYPGVEIEVAFIITPGPGTNEADMNWQIQFGDGTNATGRGSTGKSRHVYETAGQYDIDVQAWFENEKVGNAVQPFRVYSPVDLRIEQLRGSPANIRVGEDLQVAFNVNNLTAAEVFTGYDVDAFLSLTPINNAEGLADLSVRGTTMIRPDVEGEAVLNSGGSRNSAFIISVPNDLPSGDYYLVAHLDPRTKIADTDLSNNVISSTAIVRIENATDTLPDASVRGLFVIPDRAFPNITRGFKLANTGGQDAFDVVHKTYLSIGNDTLEASDVLIHTSEKVDADGRLPETNETNNRKSGDSPIRIAETFCTCSEEATEPNDSVLNAKPLSLSLSSAGICTTGNCDFYTIPLRAGDSMIVKNNSYYLQVCGNTA